MSNYRNPSYPYVPPKLEAKLSPEDEARFVLNGVTYFAGDLRRTWNEVKNPGDWKAEVSALVPLHRADAVEAAIVYFTATEVKRTEVIDGKILLESVGYRRGPAA